MKIRSNEEGGNYFFNTSLLQYFITLKIFISAQRIAQKLDFYNT